MDEVSTSVDLLPLGAIILSMRAGPDHGNIMLNFPNQKCYESLNTPLFGETLGRFASRIENGKILSLNNTSYQLPINNETNCLHGGVSGWGKKLWHGPVDVSDSQIAGLGSVITEKSVRFSLRSLHGDEGFPGTVDTSVTYTSGYQISPDNKRITVLQVVYEAELVGDAEETVVNLTNHAYFNLSGQTTIGSTQISLTTDMCLELDNSGIPSSKKPHKHPLFTRGVPLLLGAEGPDFDDCFITDESLDPSEQRIDTRSCALKLHLEAHHETSGKHLEVFSTEPAFQLYDGKHIDVPATEVAGEQVEGFGARAGFCIEPMRYTNAVNVDEWKDMVTCSWD